MNEQRTTEDAIGAMVAAWRGLLDAQVAFGSQLMQSLTGITLPSPGDVMRTARARTTASCCRIPAPCWMPQPLGECTSHVGQCKSACIRLVITNCDRVGRLVKIDSSNTAIKITPPSLSLGPLERGTISVCIDIPADAANGTRFESVIRIHGCKEYYLRWAVSVGTLGVDSCHEIAIDDCPDLVHHWYDHFYCARGCWNDQRSPAGTGAHG